MRTHCPASNFLPNARKCTITHNSETTRNARQFTVHKNKRKWEIQAEMRWESTGFGIDLWVNWKHIRNFACEERSDQKVTLAYHHSSVLRTRRGTTVGDIRNKFCTIPINGKISSFAAIQIHPSGKSLHFYF